VVDARRRATRRAFLRGAGLTFAGGAPVLVAACGDGDGDARPTDTTPADADVLNTLLDLANTGVAVYRAALPSLRGGPRAGAVRFLAQEQEHADALATPIKRLGATPNRPRSKYDIPAFANQNAFLRFAKDFEDTVIVGYLDALPKLTDRQLRGLVAAIVTNEAEHLSVLLGWLGLDQTPEAFVTGQGSSAS
jgi:hypothetical protein